METRLHHNHNQAEYHTEVDRLPCDAIFSITTSMMAAVPRLDLVPLSAGNNLLLYAGHPEEPAHDPQPKGRRAMLMLIPTASGHIRYIP